MSNSDWIGILQAVAAFLAIGAGFLLVFVQRQIELTAAGKAAGHLARHSLDFVSERLGALVDNNSPMEFALRGGRAAEMVEVFRELPVSSLPPAMIEQVAMVRSSVYAVNKRIDEVLDGDANRRHERRERLYSSGKTLAAAREEFEKLVQSRWPKEAGSFALEPLGQKLPAFLAEAQNARLKT